MDTIPITEVMPWSQRRHRFPGDGLNCRVQRELGFMLWAGTSCVLKGPWCLQEETEMRKIRLRLANGNLGAKWQNSAVVKGSTTAATVPAVVPLLTPSQPPTDTGSPKFRVRAKSPWVLWLWVWAREVSPELWGNPGMSVLRHYQMKIPIIKIEKLTHWGMWEIAWEQKAN